MGDSDGANKADLTKRTSDVAFKPEPNKVSADRLQELRADYLPKMTADQGGNMKVQEPG